MGFIPDQALWVWILLGVAVAISAWWSTTRPGTSTGKLFAPAVGIVLILLLVVFFQGAALGDLPIRF